MLEHQKLILANLQNYPDLFAKELKKSLRWLTINELNELNQWLSDNFQNTPLWPLILKFVETQHELIH
ncbi:MAG TPA: hypothetical protein PK990_08485 [Salinivirgaceae bacterium]|nr:hypothetical protein [Salinivirgaceae bacterium]